MDIVVEKDILDNVIENESETLVDKDLRNKHSVGVEKLKMTVAKPNRFGCAREFFTTLPSQKRPPAVCLLLIYFSLKKGLAIMIYIRKIRKYVINHKINLK